MKLELSSILNDVLTGKARIRDEYFLVQAAAGAAIPSTNFFVCPKRTLRLILSVQLQSTKTTATACTVYLDRIGYLIFRDVGTGQPVNAPTDDGSTKNAAEVSANTILLMKPDDYFIITHALTAGETISDIVYLRMIEWTGVDVLK